MKLILPDAIWNPAQVSGAAFLYFRDDKLAFTLHPSVSTFLTGINPLSYLKYLDAKSPSWKPEFIKFYNLWRTHQLNLHSTDKILSPLRETSISTIWLSYDRGAHALETSDEIIASSSLDVDAISGLIDPFHAADELFAHIFFEKVLEVLHPHQGQEFLVNLGKDSIRDGKKSVELRSNFEWEPIHLYIGELFEQNSLPVLLTRAYMFRMPMLQQSDGFMLSNERLISFLASLPVIHDGKKGDQDFEITTDVIAWEFFRQLLSNYVDPLDHSKVDTIRKIVKAREDEIERLKNKCYDLARELSTEKNLEKLIRLISDHIKANVLGDLQDLLQIDKKSFDQFIGEVFSDQKVWAAIATFLFSLIHGGEILTAGSAIVGLSTLGAKAFKQAATRKEKLRSSAYSLIYRMKTGAIGVRS
jgi:hypothetical protein